MESILLSFLMGLTCWKVFELTKINKLLLKELDILRIKIKQIKETKNEL